jgi:hypothetical protein
MSNILKYKVRSDTATQGLLRPLVRFVRILDDILSDFFIPKNQFLLAGCNVHNVVYRGDSKDTPDNIYFFSNDLPENPDSNSNSNNDSESDDIEMADAEEVDNHNAPEAIQADLNKVDAAKNNDSEALEYLKREYEAFFDRNTVEEGLKQVEEYLEGELAGELKRSELEAEDAQSEEEKEKKVQSSKSDDDSNNNDNNSSGGAGPSAPSGPSGDSGPPTSNSSGGNLGKILVILGGILETISKVFEDII